MTSRLHGRRRHRTGFGPDFCRAADPQSKASPQWPLTLGTYVYLEYWPPFRGVQNTLSKGTGSGFGDSLVLFATPAADADGAYYLAVSL